MSITVGAHLPEVTFRVMTDNGPAPKTTAELFNDRKVVLFAVPGAFTPTCDKNHLPGYVTHAEAIKAKGVDAILVTGVNDVFVMKAWAKSTGGDMFVEGPDGWVFGPPVPLSVTQDRAGRIIRRDRVGIEEKPQSESALSGLEVIVTLASGSTAIETRVTLDKQGRAP